MVGAGGEGGNVVACLEVLAGGGRHISGESLSEELVE